MAQTHAAGRFPLLLFSAHIGIKRGQRGIQAFSIWITVGVLCSAAPLCFVAESVLISAWSAPQSFHLLHHAQSPHGHACVSLDKLHLCSLRLCKPRWTSTEGWLEAVFSSGESRVVWLLATRRAVIGSGCPYHCFFLCRQWSVPQTGTDLETVWATLTQQTQGLRRPLLMNIWFTPINLFFNMTLSVFVQL